MRRNIQDALDQTGDPSRDLLEVPSILYRQTENGRHCRPHRKVPKKVQEDYYLVRQIDLIFKYLKHLMLTATSWALSSSDDDILVGGQAVIEGVMMRSPKGYSVAVRRQRSEEHTSELQSRLHLV